MKGGKYAAYLEDTVLETLWDQITSSIFLNTLYDIVKFVFSYLLARALVDGLYMRLKWGDWRVLVLQGDELLTSRNLSPVKAKMILTDETDLSVYIKGTVSPHAWLNIDICSDNAKAIGLYNIDRVKKKIVVDIAKNPPPKDKK